MNEEIQARWAALCGKYDSQGYELLSQNEKLWINVRDLIDSIQGGGLISYFYNAGADNLSDTFEALDRLDAPEIKKRVMRVSRLFPQPVPTDIDERNEIISSWPDEEDSEQERILNRTDEELFPLLPELEESLERFVTQQEIGS